MGNVLAPTHCVKRLIFEALREYRATSASILSPLFTMIWRGAPSTIRLSKFFASQKEKVVGQPSFPNTIA